MRKKRRRNSVTFAGFIRKLFLLMFLLCVGAAVGLVITGQWEEPYQSAMDTIDRWLKTDSSSRKNDAVQDDPSPTPQVQDREEGQGNTDSQDSSQVSQQPADQAATGLPIEQVNMEGGGKPQSPVEQTQAGATGPSDLALGQARITEHTPLPLLDAMGGIEILPETIWSMQEWIAGEGQAFSAVNRTELSLVLSIVYEAALRAGLEIGERHIHDQWDQRFKLGFDVAFDPEQADLEIYNPYQFKVKLQVAGTDQQAVASWIGEPDDNWQGPTVTVEVETFEPEELLINNYQLQLNQIRTVEEGIVGRLAKVYKQVPGENEKKLIAKDFYAPRPKVVHQGETFED